MLKSIKCEKIIDSCLNFKKGLNSIIGADDAHNSIGKSSILMLIDFCFGGSDFITKCDDVIKNVGQLSVYITFSFDKDYTFVRNTDESNRVFDVQSEEYIPLSEYLNFLSKKYLPGNCDLSFREYINGFFRISQKNNYDDQRPLHNFPKENWESIRKRTLKIFGKYWIIEDLEKSKSEKLKESKDIKGTFNSGAIKKITKKDLSINNKKINEISFEISEIKKSLKNNVTDIKLIINERNLKLKNEKDKILDSKMELQIQLSRIESNLSGSKIRNGKSFKEVIEFFPEINSDRLAEVENFHKGISKILKKQLEEEKESIILGIESANNEISHIDEELLSIVNSEESAVYLLERLIELDRLERELIQQNNYWIQDHTVKLSIKRLQSNIDEAIENSISHIETILNEGLKFFIEKIYTNNPILPKINFLKTDYKFNHGDDRGTGKSYANMIALDLTYLKNTNLPCIAHDSLLFKNIDIPAIENLISIYSGFDKQIFIAIDEIHKYDKITMERLYESQFLMLNKDRLAFKNKWKIQK